MRRGERGHSANAPVQSALVLSTALGMETMTRDHRSAAEIWQTAYGELQLQLPREAFDTWLRGARLVAHEDGTFIIGVHNVYAREWLEHRLKKVVMRTLEQIAERAVEVRFVISPPEAADQDLSSAGPLLAGLEPVSQEAPTFEALQPGQTGLNPRYRLEDYAVGESNRMAHAAALAVLDAPAEQFNPLLIHSTPGLGKTHLLHAIGNAALESGLSVLFVTAERFTNDLLAAIRTHKTEDFRDKYRSVDVLLVDDAEFMAGKESTQEEFYHTFNRLYDGGAQIILATGQSPDAIRKLDARLRSRFEGGLVVEIAAPDYQTRLDILAIKARQRGFEGRIPPEVLEVIAEEAAGSVRELEGALNRVIATALINREAPTLRVAESALSATRDAQWTISLEDVIFAVAEFYHLEATDLTGRGRSREVSAARQVAMYLANKYTNASLQAIGEALGGRNHSTVLYSCDRIDDLVQTESQVRRDVHTILQALRPQGSSTRLLRE